MALVRFLAQSCGELVHQQPRKYTACMNGIWYVLYNRIYIIDTFHFVISKKIMIAPANDELDGNSSPTTMISTTGSSNTTTTTNTNNTTTLVYIPSDEYAWLPARLLSTTQNDASTLSTTTTTTTTTTKSTSSQRLSTTGSRSKNIQTKTITVAVTRPPLPSDEPRLGLLPSTSWPEQVETLTIPENMVLPLQNTPPTDDDEQGGGTNHVTDLADLPFLHEVRSP